MTVLLMREPATGGRFGEYGGRFVPESLVPACDTLAAAFRAAWADPAFHAELDELRTVYAGRPTALTPARNLSAELGVATATAAALFGMTATVFMGARDIERQALNVHRMAMLGASVVPVTSGSRTLKDATNEAMRAWVSSVEDTHFCLGSVAGPHPYPWMVREFQRVIGDEARAQCAVPDVVIACVGGGSNAAGTFAGFVDTGARLIGVEAAGGAAMSAGVPGVVHGYRSLVLQDEHGQVTEAESIAAGLDYPGVGPEHAHLGTSGRASYVTVTDDEVLAAVRRLAHAEGIICALESAHAVAWVLRAAGTPALPSGSTVLLTLSGRGDKDMATLMAATR